MKNEEGIQIYKREYYGDFWVNNWNYQIEVCLPTNHTTIKSAKYDSSPLRFEKHDGHIVLVIYADFQQGFVNGKWTEQVVGEVLEIISWENWHRYKMSKAKAEGEIGDDLTFDYLPCATNWDELFDVNTLPEHSGHMVESLSYGILAYFECED